MVSLYTSYIDANITSDGAEISAPYWHSYRFSSPLIGEFEYNLFIYLRDRKESPPAP